MTRSLVHFVCVHNAGCSQMAAALLDHYAAGTVTVRSAGSAPAKESNRAVVKAMIQQAVATVTAKPWKWRGLRRGARRWAC